MTLFYTDPTDNHDEVKELTPLQTFYACEDYTPEHAMVYINSLEQEVKLLNSRLKCKNDALSDLLNIIGDRIALYKNQIEKIIRL